MKHEFMIVVQNPQALSEPKRKELVNIVIPFDNFTIVDSDGNQVDYDNFRAQVRVD
jgi:hypothetical protein